MNRNDKATTSTSTNGVEPFKDQTNSALKQAKRDTGRSTLTVALTGPGAFTKGSNPQLTQIEQEMKKEKVHGHISVMHYDNAEGRQTAREMNEHEDGERWAEMARVGLFGTTTRTTKSHHAIDLSQPKKILWCQIKNYFY